ncbi:50S ribosomal protein L24 [Borrelia hermsii]|uniref:Large ribosomal subunit protein uL24 n=3 Tax=Borrelia hermsii TaxID=140 RepID=RL24_BORHD|nr:50S ribosomal protein L24 [Borrelia hermsii]B2S0J2.1 RecName: Full=Large ribosomal subunit protein uL24; AltName: Full=50S ribosomal protein L24 [Borrelia hermsii DAH]AAX16998.1 LSU ribosomal protein L24P [Borrelia hermsii DAH]AHH12512.1 LSU ribosomal protein L24P [Borrelia hermsii YBT]AJW73290.1 50S ribosomal protein L24 [Borrelia hermsii CC1]AMR75357.1 50S ribosomal protein L24 [Borrelia hermsii]ANA43296.1 50S ribosomal protein L24 [Borrelia hermsii HS1]
MKTKLKVGDNVKILCGKDRGKTGEIVSIDRKNLKVVVKSCNMVKKVIKARTPQEKSKIIDKEAPVDISNVMLFSNGITSRVGIKFENKEKKRYLKKNGENV